MTKIYSPREDNMKQTITHILTALLLLTIFTACGLRPQAIKEPSSQTSTQPTEPAESVTVQAEQKVDLLLEQQAYAEAISYAAESINQNQAARLAKPLVKAINAGLNQSGLLMQSGHFEQAARLLKTIKTNYPMDATRQQQVSKTSAQVDNDFTLSTQKMMDAGLIAYRAGDFPTAIDIWENILAIDPDHAAAQNSLETTLIQLSKLKDLHNKNESPHKW